MIDWNVIDTVLLDMDGTLLDLHFDNFFWMQHIPRVYAQTHDLGEALTLSDKIIVLSARPGRLKEVFEVPFDAETPLGWSLHLPFPQLKYDHESAPRQPRTLDVVAV